MNSYLEDWGAWQRAGGLSNRTIDERRNVVNALLQYNDVSVEQLQPVHIIRFLGRPTLTATSKATYHASIRAFCSWAIRVGIRDDDPTIKTPTPKRPKGVPRPLHSSQLIRLLGAANRQRTKMMVLLGALAGLRIHEIAKVRGEDFDLSGMTLIVNGKGGKTEIIPLHRAIADAARYFPERGYWFRTYVGNSTGPSGPILSRSVGKAIGDTMTRAGVSAVPHQLRHWYGTELLEQGEELRTVQELMRHDSVATTEIYTKVSNMRKRAAIEKLSLPLAS